MPNFESIRTLNTMLVGVVDNVNYPELVAHNVTALDMPAVYSTMACLIGETPVVIDRISKDNIGILYTLIPRFVSLVPEGLTPVSLEMSRPYVEAIVNGAEPFATVIDVMVELTSFAEDPEQGKPIFSWKALSMPIKVDTANVVKPEDAQNADTFWDYLNFAHATRSNMTSKRVGEARDMYAQAASAATSASSISYAMEDEGGPTGTIVDDSKRNALKAMHGMLANVTVPSKYHVPLVDLTLAELVTFLTAAEMKALLYSVEKVTDYVLTDTE